MSIKMMAFGLAALAILSVVGVGYTHYRNVLAEREAALAERDMLTIENAGLAASRDAFEEQAETLQEAMVDMTAAAAQAELEVDQLNETLRKHDLAKLAKAKPGLIERRINRGTADVLGMFVAATAPAGDGSGGSSAEDNPAAPSAD